MMKMMKNIILKTWFWLAFIRNKETLPTKSDIYKTNIKYEIISGSFIWDDEGLWELKNQQLNEAFKFVLKYRMFLIAGQNYNDFMRSKSFDKCIFKMAKKHFPEWIGFQKSRCSYNYELRDRILRIKKVEDWRLQKIETYKTENQD